MKTFKQLMVEVQKIHDVTIQKIGGTIDGNAIDNQSTLKNKKKDTTKKQGKSAIVFHKGESDGNGPGTIGL